MAVPHARFSLLLLIFLLSSSLHTTLSTDPPQISPSPSPNLSPASSLSPSPLVSSSAPDSAPAISPLASSPPAPSPESQTPTLSPSPSLAPAPADGGVVSHTGVSDGEGTADGSSGEMNAGNASYKDVQPSIAPSLTLTDTGHSKQPDPLQIADGWANFTCGFFFGGISDVTSTTLRLGSPVDL